MKRKLGDICKIVSGTTPKTGCPEYWDGDIKWITPAEIHDDTYIVTDTERKITELGVRKTGLSPFPAGTVILSSRAPIGKVAIAGCEMYCNQGFKNLICSEKIHNKYLYWFLKGKKEFLNTLGRGATFKEISKAIVEQIEIELPDLAQQIRIAAIFESLRSLLLFRRPQLSALDELVKVRFVEMFGDPRQNTFGWDIKKIGECCTLKSGTSLPANTENEGGPIPYVKVGDMNLPENARFITTSSRFVSVATAGRGLFPVGSILFPKRGAAIGTNKKRMTMLPICADLNIMGVTSNGDLLPEYLLFYFDMIDLGTLHNGSSVPQINNKDIAPLLIAIPPLALQKQFAVFVARVEKTKASVRASLTETQTLFDSLMQEFFGKVSNYD